LGETDRIAKKSKKHSLLEERAKEDARYVVSLATEGQLGLTINARNLEFLIRRFASKTLAEIRELNKRIYELVKDVAPSIILFTEASDFDARTYGELKEKAGSLMDLEGRESKESVELVDFTPEADEKLIAALLHTSSALPYKECFRKAQCLKHEEKKDLVRTVFKHMEFYDFALREFEYVDLTFNMVVSATCFAQLKRHRMATLTTQHYNPELGVTIPPSVEKVGFREEFLGIMQRTDGVYHQLKEHTEEGAAYVLTNAHRKRVLLKVNARELYHISRLREDRTAQWDIRRVAQEMTEKAREVMPLTCLLIGGKDKYPQIYKGIVGKDPKLLLPES